MKLLNKTLIASASLLALLNPLSASAQLIPQPWVSVGSKDGDITYSAGARALNLGAEIGVGPDGSTGVDVLKFYLYLLSLPTLAWDTIPMIKV